MSRPEGVRVVHADGTTDLCELAFAYVDVDGCEVWAAYSPVDFLAGDRITIEHMPPHTGIEFPMPTDPRE